MSIRTVDQFYERIPTFTALSWAVFCISMIFVFPIPIIGLATTTVFAIPHLLFAFLFLTKYNNAILFFLLLILTVSLVFAAVWVDHWSATYFNFIFWLVNSYAAYKMLRHPHGREIALNAWAFAIAVLVILRLVELLGLVDIRLFNRNGYGFMMTIFLAPLYWAAYRKGGPKAGMLVLGVVVITLLMNASRSSIINSTLLIVVLLLHFNLGFHRRLVTTVSVAMMALGLFLFLPTITAISPVLNNHVNWVSDVIASGELSTIREGSGRTIELREALAQKSFALFERSPFAGVGFGEYNTIRNIDIQLYFNQNNLAGIVEHNSYLLWLAETGLAGTIPLMFFVIYVLWKARQCRRGYLKTGETYLVIGMVMTLSVCFTLAFLANITAAGTWVAWIVAVAFHDSYQTTGADI